MAQGQRKGSSTRGFKRTASLLSERFRKAGEARGFAVTRLLTHWDEIAGPDIARMARPVEVSYARRGASGGMGATLSLLTTGPNAPLLEMQKERIRDRVNACYGYNAIARVRITQTAPTGFAEGQVAFGRDARRGPPEPSPEARAKATEVLSDLGADAGDPGLRAALERLGAHVMSRTAPSKTRIE